MRWRRADWRIRPPHVWPFPNRQGTRPIDITVAQKLYTMAKLRAGITVGAAQAHRVELADLVRAHGAAYQATHPLCHAQRRALRAIVTCRTAALGGHRAVCTTCGAERITYNSCRNRHCPKCQRVATERWLTARRREVLPIPYFHFVFTLPHALNPLAQSHRRSTVSCSRPPPPPSCALAVTRATSAVMWAAPPCSTPGANSTLLAMVRPVEVRPLAPYRIWLRYQDGSEGEVDLSHLAGRGVFAAWEQEGVFTQVKLGSHGQLEWPGGLDLCPDALYLTLTGKTGGGLRCEGVPP